MVARLILAIHRSSPVLQALRHLGQKHAANPAFVHQGKQLVKRGQGEGVNAVAAQVGNLPGCLVGGHALGQAAQIFY